MYWLNKAKDFNASVFAIEETRKNKKSSYLVEKLGITHAIDCSLSATSAFLCGTALELLMKACWVEKEYQKKLNELCLKKKSSVCEDEINVDLGKLEKFFMHDLKKLAEKIEFKCKPKDNILLERYTHVLYWQGRYPIPRVKAVHHEQRNIDIFLPNDSNETLMFRKFDPELMLIIENYERLWNNLYSYYSEIADKIK